MLSFGYFEDFCAQRPMDLGYMKLLRNLLRITASWRDQIIGEPENPLPLRDSRVTFLESFFVFLGGIIYIKVYYSTVPFIEMGHTYVTVFLSVVCIRATIAWFQAYHQMLKQFLLEMHLIYHRRMTEYSEMVYHKVNKICAAFAMFNVIETCCGVFLYNVIPVFNNYINGMYSGSAMGGKRFEHSINYYLPFIDQQVDMVAYIPVAFYNLFISFEACFGFCTYDVTMSIMVFHIWGHLKILGHNLRSIPLPEAMRDQSGRSEDDHEALLYSKEENIKVAVMLKDIIDHHKKIMSFLNVTSDAFGLTLCIYYLFHQVSGCVFLVECAELDARSLTRYGPLSLTLMQVFVQISVIVELLGTESETLKDAVYSIPWECMDTSNRRIVLFLLHNVQEPIRLKPLGIVSVGVRTMATIFKTTFSYFMLLKTFT